ncbi:PR5-like receptor kinase [Corylus avellana]|uniref:PR5-like receptor kinase n=1 Tax=Corylus avellana TaxID=13451 RepID=UPI00286B81FB|nr:PR5-like receptor kinase [Corylus avellana]
MVVIRFIYSLKKESLTNQTIQAFLRNQGPLAIRRYSHSNIKKMTNFFRDKLGEGGFGGVYKGKLEDGCLVAVKVLKEFRGNREELINEVASISRTSHVNIVSFMGFCFEGSKRALIYEFMSNGSLENYGMIVFEMVGGRRNIDAEIDCTSEIFFPHYIYKRLQQDEDLGLRGLMKEEDHKIARKMIIAGLWCIQTDPSSRPPISRVVNLLEGSLESLQVPPKPFLSSPTRSPKDSSTTVSLQYDSIMH